MIHIIMLTMSLAHPVQYTTVPTHDGRPELGVITRLPDGRSVETKPIHDGHPEYGTTTSGRNRDSWEDRQRDLGDGRERKLDPYRQGGTR
jgi:hypothetical protein